MQPFSHDDFWEVEVDWKRPQQYVLVRDGGSIHDDATNLNLISGRYGSADPKALHIGKTWSLKGNERLHQSGHSRRYGEIVNEPEYSRNLESFYQHGVSGSYKNANRWF